MLKRFMIVNKLININSNLTLAQRLKVSGVNSFKLTAIALFFNYFRI